jgi:uncharacterized protein (DUF58 family)
MSPLTIVLIALGAGAVLVAAGAAVLALLLSSKPTAPSANAIQVQVQNCTVDRNVFQATVKVTNNGNRSRTAVIDVQWLNSDGTRVASSTVIANDLAPGQSSLEQAATFGTVAIGVRCTASLR